LDVFGLRLKSLRATACPAVLFGLVIGFEFPVRVPVIREVLESSPAVNGFAGLVEEICGRDGDPVLPRPGTTVGRPSLRMGLLARVTLAAPALLGWGMAGL
jgi:hypothetical protein